MFNWKKWVGIVVAGLVVLGLLFGEESITYYAETSYENNGEFLLEADEYYNVGEDIDAGTYKVQDLESIEGQIWLGYLSSGDYQRTYFYNYSSVEQKQIEIATGLSGNDLVDLNDRNQMTLNKGFGIGVIDGNDVVIELVEPIEILEEIEYDANNSEYTCYIDDSKTDCNDLKYYDDLIEDIENQQ